MLDLQQRFDALDGPLIKPGRRVLYHSAVHIMGRTGNLAPRAAILLSDKLLLARLTVTRDRSVSSKASTLFPDHHFELAAEFDLAASTVVADIVAQRAQNGFDIFSRKLSIKILVGKLHTTQRECVQSSIIVRDRHETRARRLGGGHTSGAVGTRAAGSLSRSERELKSFTCAQGS